MNKVIEQVMAGDAPIDADILCPPTPIIPAIELTAMRFATRAPIEGQSVLDSPLTAQENAAQHDFPGRPC